MEMTKKRNVSRHAETCKVCRLKEILYISIAAAGGANSGDTLAQITEIDDMKPTVSYPPHDLCL